jgi:hypothetical protein
MSPMKPTRSHPFLTEKGGAPNFFSCPVIESLLPRFSERCATRPLQPFLRDFEIVFRSPSTEVLGHSQPPASLLGLRAPS